MKRRELTHIRLPQLLAVGTVALLAACGSESEAPVAESETPQSDLRFVDVTDGSGIDFHHENGATGRRFMPETTIGGAGWIDYDRDGFLDIYLVSGNEHPDTGENGSAQNRLYRNLGSGKFRDVTRETGVGHTGYGGGLAVGDFDGDGWPDLYVTNYGTDVLYRNEGGKRFRDVAEAAGIGGPGWSTSAAFLDYDADGHLDLYVCRYVVYDAAKKCETRGQPTYCSPSEFSGAADILYRNLGNGTFEDVSREAGIAVAGADEGKSLGVIALDYDDDGDQDIYVACDQVANLLFRNNGDGTFREVGLLASVAYSLDGKAQAGMGVDAGDVDLDGRVDLVVTNFADERNAVYRNDGGGLFSEVGIALRVGGLSLPSLGFGVLLTDFDLDSDLDMYVANGHVQDNVATFDTGKTFAQRDQLLRNEAGRGFADISAAAGDWFSTATVSRSAASADFDEDGDEDILILNCAGRAVLLRNDSRVGHWIAFRLRGTRSHRDAFGAKVTVSARRGTERFTRVAECRSARSYAAACDPRVRVGLGAGDVKVERVDIRWPSAKVTHLDSPGLDRVHDVTEDAE